jgi:MFS family permease
VVAVFALVTAGWQVVTGGLLDRFRTPRLILPMYASAMAGMLILQFATGSVAIVLAGVLLGIGMGAEYAALSYFVSRYFGLRHFGTIVGAFYAVVAFIQGVAPMLMDMSFDASHSYAGATLTIVAALALGMVLLALLPHPDRFAGGLAARRELEAAPGDLALA